MGGPLSAPDGKHDEHYADCGRLENLAGSQAAKINSHQERDGNRHCDSEGSPRAVFQRVDDNECDCAQQYDDDRDDCDIRDESAETANFRFRHLGKRLSVAADREQKNDEILHTSAEDCTGENPERAGQVAELCGEDRADEWSGAGDGGEMMSEDDPFAGWNKVATVIQTFGGGWPGGVEGRTSRR